MVRVLMNNVFYLKDTISRGFIYFDENSIIEEGSEPQPEYELSELVYGFKDDILVMHGFSVVVSPTRYLYRGLRITDLSVFNKNEIEKLAYSALYELLVNGVTLPVINDENPDIIARTLFENGIKGVVIVERGTSRRVGDNIYLERDGVAIYYDDSKLGDLKDLVCQVNNFRRDCFFLDISSEASWNLSTVTYHIVKTTSVDIDSVIRVLTNPYRFLRVDSGKIEKGSKPDLLAYDLKNSFITTPMDALKYVVLRGYPPDYVFLNGDAFVEKKEPLVLIPLNILDMVIKKTL